jgi:hypothetical protein
LRRFAVLAAAVAMLIGTGAVVTAAAHDQRTTGMTTLSERTSAANVHDDSQPSPSANSQASAACKDAEDNDVDEDSADKDSADKDGPDEDGPDGPDCDNNQKDDHEVSNHHETKGEADHNDKKGGAASSKDSKEHDG